jgi:hypothetical protein
VPLPDLERLRVVFVEQLEREVRGLEEVRALELDPTAVGRMLKRLWRRPGRQPMVGVMGRASSAALAVAICVLAVGCGAQKKNVTTTEHVEYRLSVSRGASVGGAIGSDTVVISSRPLTREAAAREVRGYMRRHYGAAVDARCTRDGQFMDCTFWRNGACEMLSVIKADNGAGLVVTSGMVGAPRSSCP